MIKLKNFICFNSSNIWFQLTFTYTCIPKPNTSGAIPTWMHIARAEVLTMLIEGTQVFMDVQACKGETVKGLDIIHGYKNLKKDTLLKGKAILLQALTGPEGSRRLRLPDFKTIGT
jgi:hypothetical protein